MVSTQWVADDTYEANERRSEQADIGNPAKIPGHRPIMKLVLNLMNHTHQYQVRSILKISVL